MKRTSVAAVAVVAVGSLIAACSSDTRGTSQSSTTSTPPTTAALPKADASPVALSDIGVDPAAEGRCDPIGARCMLPLPNDHFTVEDDGTPTKRRLALPRDSMPANVAGVPIDVTDQNRADGWSPGSTILTQLDGIDLVASKAPTIGDPQRSLDDDSPIVLFDATTGRRHPFWAELDANADPGEPALLMLHPARNLPDGHRIVVALRGLTDAAGTAVAPSPAFGAYRDGQRTTDTTFEARRPHMEAIFSDLAAAGVERSDLQQAWDFTVASTESLTGRLVAMRDDAFGELGDAAPTFTVGEVTENPNENVARRVTGTFQIPLYLTDGGATGSRLVLDDAGVPQRQSGSFTATFTCNLPAAARTKPARIALYGHGLLGDQGEVNGDLTQKMSADHDIAYCATDWYGMAAADIGTAAAALQDLSNFPKLTDRLQQGLLAFMFLGRAAQRPDGFGANPAFQFDGRSALDASALYYDGNSQGSILGGALTAVSPDIDRAVLAEAGMNYSILLDRSVDFDEYLAVMRAAYPKRFDRVIGLEMIQLLWDRGETDGYANHLAHDHLPGAARSDVLLIGAVGDHQVSEYSLRVEAATVGARAHAPLAAPGRVQGKDPAWLLKPIERFPFSGSSYWLWDTGSPSSPATNTPPTEGHDPHDDTPNIPSVRQMKSEFWQPDGAITDPCGDQPCTAPVPPENA